VQRVFCEAPHYAVFSNLIAFHSSLVHIFSSAPYSQVPSVCTSLNVRDKLLHPYRTTGKNTVLSVLIFMFLDSRLEEMVAGIPPTQSALISS
jgi:hypothetical protein